MHDTSPAIAKKMSEMIQLKTLEERIEISCSMYETSKYLIIRSIMEKNPNISSTNLRLEFFLRFYGDDYDSVVREKILNHLRNKTLEKQSLK